MCDCSSLLSPSIQSFDCAQLFSHFDSQVELTKTSWAVTLIQKYTELDPHTQMVIECVTEVGKRIVYLAEFEGNDKNFRPLNKSNPIIGKVKFREMEASKIKYLNKSETLGLSCCKVSRMIQAIQAEMNSPSDNPTVYYVYGDSSKTVKRLAIQDPLLRSIYEKHSKFIMELRKALINVGANVQLGQYIEIAKSSVDPAFSFYYLKCIFLKIESLLNRQPHIKQLFEEFEKEFELDDDNLGSVSFHFIAFHLSRFLNPISSIPSHDSINRSLKTIFTNDKTYRNYSRDKIYEERRQNRGKYWYSIKEEDIWGKFERRGYEDYQEFVKYADALIHYLMQQELFRDLSDESLQKFQRHVNYLHDLMTSTHGPVGLYSYFTCANHFSAYPTMEDLTSTSSKRVYLIFLLLTTKITSYKVAPKNCHTWCIKHLEKECGVTQELSFIGKNIIAIPILEVSRPLVEIPITAIPLQSYTENSPTSESMVDKIIDFFGGRKKKETVWYI